MRHVRVCVEVTMGRRGGGGRWIARRDGGGGCLSVFERAVVAFLFGVQVTVTKLFVEESAEATGRYNDITTDFKYVLTRNSGKRFDLFSVGVHITYTLLVLALEKVHGFRWLSQNGTPWNTMERHGTKSAEK
jgi:hypothetical protein